MSKSKNKNRNEVPSPDPDEAYNLYVASAALNILSKKAKARIQTDVDKQLASLQGRVKQNLDVLEETRQKLSAVSAMKDQTELLQFEKDLCENLKDQPIFANGNSFTQLSNEMDQIKNQLPCSGFSALDSRTEIVQSATSDLIQSLDRISQEYDGDCSSTAASASSLSNCHKLREKLIYHKECVETYMPKASSHTVKEVVSKIGSGNLHLGTE